MGKEYFLVMNQTALLRFLLPARKMVGFYSMLEYVEVDMDYLRAVLRHLNPFLMPSAVGE